MGNTLLDETRKQDPGEVFEQWLEQNPSLIARRVLSHNKLFESDYFRYRGSSIKMGVFFRRDKKEAAKQTQSVVQEEIKVFQMVQRIVDRRKCTHIMPMKILDLRAPKDTKEKELDKFEQSFTIALRQHLHSTLEDRLNCRPLLTPQEKQWTIYQIIFAVYTLHQVLNFYHGHLRTSNFLCTTYQYLLMTDLAHYKPTQIQQDTEHGLAQFRLFYSSSVDKCSLAPQKLTGLDQRDLLLLTSKHFINEQFEPPEPPSDSLTRTEAGSPMKRSKKINQEENGDLNRLKAMDMYSLGMVILQVLRDGKTDLDYQELLRMKKEGFNFQERIKEGLKGVQREQTRTALQEILTGLLREKPASRMNITQVLQRYVQCIDLQNYSLFWCCLSAFNRASFSSSDSRIHLLWSIVGFTEEHVRQSEVKLKRKPPRCMQHFNSLKIFTDMIKNKFIFAPSLGEGDIIGKMIAELEKREDEEGKESSEDEMLFEDEDERRKFFIKPSKKSKIAKRLSFVQERPAFERELCPPDVSQLAHLVEIRQTPIKLTQLGLKTTRLEQLLEQYKEQKHVRDQRMHRTPHYRNAEIIIKIIFGCVRSCRYVASKLMAIELIDFIGRDCSDQVRLTVLFPLLKTLTEDADISVAQEAFFALINLFYGFVDPFHCEEDTKYFEIVLEYFTGIIKESKLRLRLFGHFREVFLICEWLEIHFKRWRGEGAMGLMRVVEVIKVHYGSYSREEVRVLLNGNIPHHILSYMFEFYISLINTDRVEGLKLSLTIARAISPATHKHILDVFDSCIESGLEEEGIGLFYAIQYFTLRKSATNYLIRKIAPHVINPSLWIRDEALRYVQMCLTEFPPTKNYFFFKDIFEIPFPLKPEDIHEEVLLPEPLREGEVDWRDRRLKGVAPSLTAKLFGEYLRNMKKADRTVAEELAAWSSHTRVLREEIDESRILGFESYVKRQLELLYDNNFLYFTSQTNAKSDRQQQEKGYAELASALRKNNRFNDLTSIDHEKKELFELFQGIVNTNFEKLLSKKHKESQVLGEKRKLAESILVIGEVLSKFEMFKIKPIPRLGTYVRPPTILQKLPRPKGALICEIYDHKDTVTCLEKVADQFFMSGSSDGTMRIYDSRKLQSNVSFGCEAHIQIRGEGAEEKVKISSIGAFEQTYAVVVGTSRGQIRIYPIERLPSRSSARHDEMIKYSVTGELEKIITLPTQQRNECFSYITAEGCLGVQDIRSKTRSMSCSIGKERGLPRALCATGRNSILVGTVNGYVVNFDIRYNIISNVLQLHSEGEPVPVTGISPCLLQGDQKEQLFAFTYPSRHYEFSCFDIYENRAEVLPQRHYSSVGGEEIVALPYLVSKTSEEQFKLCRNGLVWRRNYDELSDFNKHFSIFDYLSDPLTRKEAKIRNVWLEGCKNRYNQISSIYTKKNLPFLEYIGSSVLTCLNPAQGSLSELKSKKPLTLLSERRQGKEKEKEYSEIERVMATRPSGPTSKVFTFPEEENRDYATCCRTLPSMVVVGYRNSVIQVYA